MIQRKDITDEEVIEECNRFWEIVNRIPLGMLPFQVKYPEAPFDVLSKKYPPRVVLRKLEHMERRRIIESGVSLRVPWVRKS